ncbi:unnamed protein product [Musa banksii]
MDHITILVGRKAGSTTTSGCRRSGRAAATATTGQQYCGSNCGLGKLMRKLRKQSKMLCMATRPTTFHCQYDPLSYSRNFDRNGFGTALDDDSNHFYYTFSSRFIECIPAYSHVIIRFTLLEKLKSLYSNLEGLPPDRIVPTVGLNIGRVEASNAKLVFWDLGGQIGLRTIWEKYYEEAHAIVYVIDAGCPSSFEDSKSALGKVLRHEDLQGAPLLILANKQDLPGAVSTEELARYLDLKELNERLYMIEAVSAYNGTGIKFAIDWLVDVMERSKRTEMLRVRAGVTGHV